MSFDLQYDHTGKPFRVNTDNGFAQVSRPYEPDSDGWMENQLDPNEFEAVRIGDQTLALIHKVNALMKKNFELERDLKMWKKASGMF